MTIGEEMVAMRLFVTVLTRCRPPVPFLARTTLSLLEMYMYLGGTKCETIFPCSIVYKCKYVDIYSFITLRGTLIEIVNVMRCLYDIMINC